MAGKTQSEEIGRAIRKTQEVDSDIGKGGETEGIIPLNFIDEINPYFCRARSKKRTYISGTWIWGQSVWGDGDVWNTLEDATDTLTIVEVHNDNNCFLEPLNNNDFVWDYATNCTMDYINHTMALGSGEYMTSDVIALKQDTPITSVTLSIITDDYNLDESTIYLSNGNDIWDVYTEGLGNNHAFSTVGSELKYGIIAGSDNQYVNGNENLLLFKVVYNN